MMPKLPFLLLSRFSKGGVPSVDLFKSEILIPPHFQVESTVIFCKLLLPPFLSPSCHCRWIQEVVPCGRRSKRGGWLFSCRSDHGSMILNPGVTQ